VKQVKWGIIGLGNVALQFADAFRYVKNAKLVAIASQDKSKIAKFKNKFKIDEKYCFSEYENLLLIDEVDIVYISLPNSLHHKWIVKSIKNKKKILVEKPATVNFLEIEDIKKNYYNEDVFFAEAFTYSFHPQIIKVIELLKNNIIGKLESMETFFGKNILTKKNFFGFIKKKKIDILNRKYNKKLGGGVILDLGCYPVSFSTLIASLISKINYDKVQLIEKKKNIGITGVDIDASVDLIFENGFKSKIYASFSKDLGRSSKIIGSEGQLIIENTWHAKPALISIISKEDKKIYVKCNDNIFSYEIEAISKCLLEKKKKPTFPGLTIEETHGNMKILEKWLN
jgi:predicted dehydrogenase